MDIFLLYTAGLLLRQDADNQLQEHIIHTGDTKSVSDNIHACHALYQLQHGLLSKLYNKRCIISSPVQLEHRNPLVTHACE